MFLSEQPVHGAQLNFQHGSFPAHVDECGFFNPTSLEGGDGFGSQIMTYQLGGPSVTVFFSGKVPGSDRHLGSNLTLSKEKLMEWRMPHSLEAYMVYSQPKRLQKAITMHCACAVELH